MPFAVAVRSILDACAECGASVRTALVVGPEGWKTTFNIAYGLKTMRFADPGAVGAAFYATVPAHPLEAARAKGGAAIRNAHGRGPDLVAVDPTACAVADIASLAINFAGVSAVAVVAPDGIDDLRAFTPADRALFDLGFARVTPAGTGPDNRTVFLYLRTDFIPDIRRLDPRRAHAASLSGLPRLGRYANQCLQVIGMTLYGARNNAAAVLPEWTGNIIFDLPPGDDRVAGPLTVSRSFSLDDALLWDRDAEPPVDVDFEAFFQSFPRSYETHKVFIRRMLRFRDHIAGRIHAWFDETVPADSHLVAIHVRRGDYLLFQKDAPGLTVTPVDWYRAFLARMWPALSNPRLVVATDEPQMLQFFQEYRPLDLRASHPHLVGGEFVADFIALQRADVMLMCNSSFSRSAALLTCNDRQMAFKPGWAYGGFVPVDPWSDRRFWDWFAHLDMPEPGVLIDLAKRAAARGDGGRMLELLRAALAVDPANGQVRDALRRMGKG